MGATPHVTSQPHASACQYHPLLPGAKLPKEREFFIDNLLVRIRFIIVMIRWTGLAPWEFEFPFPGSFISTFLESIRHIPKSVGPPRVTHLI